MIKTDVVLPVYRNQETLVELTERLRHCAESQDWNYRFIFVDDASPDQSGEILDRLAEENPRVQVLHLPINLGQHAATLRGLELAESEFTFVMDADLQDPPEALPRLMEKISEGYAVVFAGRRGKYESSLRLFSSRLFKSFLHWSTGIPRDAGAFLLMTREARIALRQAKFRSAFLPGMVGALKLSNISVPVHRQARPAGTSSYRGTDRLRVGLKAIASLLLYKSKDSQR